MNLDFSYTYLHKTELQKSNHYLKLGVLSTRWITDYSRKFMKELISLFKDKILLFMTYELYLRIRPEIFPKEIQLSLIFDQKTRSKVSLQNQNYNEYYLDTKNLANNKSYLLKDLFLLELIDKLLILEATKYSKNISTVTSLSAEKGKDVYCLPGRYFDFSSYGTNKLIFDGAIPMYSLDLLKD